MVTIEVKNIVNNYSDNQSGLIPVSYTHLTLPTKLEV